MGDDEDEESENKNDNDNPQNDLSQMEQDFDNKESEENKAANDQQQTKMTLKERMNFYLQHFYSTLFFSVLTIWVLFGDDIKNLTTTIDSDSAFSVVTIVIMSLFLIEFILSCIFIDDYIFSFFFWLDFISVISMIIDVSLVS